MADGYDSMDDPYAYKGSSTLKNKIGLRNSAELESFELEMTALRAQEALPSGNLDARHNAVYRTSQVPVPDTG